MLAPPPLSNASSRLHRLLRHPATIGTTKVVFFCAKAFSILSPCQPFLADPRVLYPLLCIASLDFLFVSFGIRFMGRYISLGGLGGSVVLLLVHMMVVGILLRWDMLCSRRGVAWDEL
jgi:hypothetical protein